MTNPLTAFQSALAVSGTAPLDISAGPGDSITEGAVATHREDAWPQRLRDNLRAGSRCGDVRGGLGYAPSFSVSSSVGDFWQTSGAIVRDSTLHTGLGQRMLKIPNGASASLTFQGTGIDLLYTAGTNSAFYVSIDGGLDLLIDARLPVGLTAGNVKQYRGLCDGSHTIVVKGSGLGSAYLEGAMIYRCDEACGIRMWESGHSGFMASDYNATDHWHGSFTAVPAPKLIIPALGINEYTNMVGPSAFRYALADLCDTLESLIDLDDTSVVLMSEHERVAVPGGIAWDDYEYEIQLMAGDRGYGYFAASSVIGPPAAAIAAGLLQTGTGLHPTTAGHLKIANGLANYLRS